MLSRAGHLEYDRVLFFSDAVFAIAITLPVVDLRVPNLPARLIHAGQQRMWVTAPAAQESKLNIAFYDRLRPSPTRAEPPTGAGGRG